MSINNFIPQVWSGRILTNLSKSLIYAQAGIVNRDYEGDIAQAGDTVKIQSIGDPTITAYTKNTDMSGPETLTDATRSLVIDQAYSFNFQVDDIDKAQARGGVVLDEALRRAAYKLGDVADQYVAGLMAAASGANTIGSTGTPIAIDGTSVFAYDQLVKAKIKLDVALAPSDGRWVIVPSWFGAALSLDQRFIGTNGYNGNTVLANGEIGMAAGFRVLVSQNVVNTAGAKYKIVAGVNGATTYAEQINETEAYRPQLRFGDAVKGLHLYGAKVVRPTELVVITANDTAGLGS
jgi:N4-gp56 family major capsid protein